MCPKQFLLQGLPVDGDLRILAPARDPHCEWKLDGLRHFHVKTNLAFEGVSSLRRYSLLRRLPFLRVCDGRWRIHRHEAAVRILHPQASGEVWHHTVYVAKNSIGQCDSRNRPWCDRPCNKYCDSSVVLPIPGWNRKKVLQAREILGDHSRTALNIARSILSEYSASPVIMST